MIEGIITYGDDSIKDGLEKVNPDAIKIFQWFTYTLNMAGHVPHIYETDEQGVTFLIRKMKGTKINIRWDLKLKMVSLANFIFRSNQKTWPIKVLTDIQGGEYINYFAIKLSEKLRPICENHPEMSDDSEHIDEPSQPLSEGEVDLCTHQRLLDANHPQIPLPLEEDALFHDVLQTHGVDLQYRES